MEEILCRLSKELDEIIKEEVEEFSRTIYYQIIYDFQTCYKLKSDEIDLSCDYSENTYIFEENPNFSITDYETIGDFLKEYSSKTITEGASNGVFYSDTFENHYKENLEKQLKEKFYVFLTEIDSNDYEELVMEVYGEIPDESNRDEAISKIAFYFEKFECAIIQKVEEVMTLMKQASLLFWYKKLDKQIGYELEKEKGLQQEEYIECLKQIGQEEQRFYRLWSILEKSYKLMYQKNMPERINMDQYNEFVTFLDWNNVTNEEILLLLSYAPIHFSGEVKDLLGEIDYSLC